MKTTGGMTWRKSTYSGTGDTCVELARHPDGLGIRDSKNTDRPHLTVGVRSVAALVGALKTR